jgi:hypothetical protein
MDRYKGFNLFPGSYFKGLPCNKFESMKILKENGKKKKDFKNDEDLRTYLTNEHGRKKIDEALDIIGDNPTLQLYAALRLSSQVRKIIEDKK